MHTVRTPAESAKSSLFPGGKCAFPRSNVAQFYGNCMVILQVITRYEKATNLNLEGLEQATDIVFPFLNRSISLKAITRLNLRGCYHLTDKAVDWIALSCNQLQEVTNWRNTFSLPLIQIILDGCFKIGSRALQHLVCGQDRSPLQSVSAVCTSIAMVPRAVLYRQLDKLDLSGCPLIHTDYASTKIGS